LFSEIDLEADVINDLVRFLWAIRYTTSDGDDCDKIDEGLSAFAVVDDGGLTLLIGGESLFQVGHGI
jgi:hypothetical protein